MINKQELLKISENVLFDEPMSAHTSFRIGGPAQAFLSASSKEEIIGAIEYCRENSVGYMIMGNGSNMLVSDKGIRGLVIQVGKNMSKCEIRGERVYAEAGVLMSALASAALKAELSGFEALSGIPGTVGGGIYMNAGAYGSEMKQVIETVTYLNEAGDIITSPADKLDFGYRHSIFEEGGYVILSCVIALKKGKGREIAAQMKEYNRRRSEKQPLSMPSAGSTFKRPEGYFAGKLIQDCGLMGFSVGGAQVSEKHAGFVVNRGGATALDVLTLIEHIQKTVYEKFGVRLEPEVRLIGEK
ncbi:MAG: UDP-N-acetylmuramate dehydrogenase [Clostridiales bacterium]|nr:UDP-N-acetylmuramate dehydrogenase [Clostridiales bacterium]